MNLLVPVAFSRSIDRTVGYALDRLPRHGGSIHLVHTATPGRHSHRDRQVHSLLRRLESLSLTRAGGEIDVETAYLARDQYLASPHDHAAEYAAYARAHEIDLVILDPTFSVDATDPTLRPVRHAFDRAGLPYEIANVQRTALPGSAEIARFLTVAGLALAFYLAVGPFFVLTNPLVGIAGAILTGILFRNVVFETTPGLVQVLGALVRGLVYLPYLLGKILVANVQISYIILHPDLPIDPHLDRIQTGLRGGLTVTALANSLTLTPGTLTVDAVRDELLVHSITRNTRIELLGGGRQRAIEFVYYGRVDSSPGYTTGSDRIVTEAGRTDASALISEGDDE